MSNEKIVVLNSGGFDSTILLNSVVEAYSEDEIINLFFNYGQLSLEQERACARKNSEKLGCQFFEIELPKMDWTQNNFYNKNFDGTPSQYLEMRNLIFISYALSYCESIKAKSIYMAILKSHHGYKDTSPQFFKKVNQLSERILGVTVHTPFATLEKCDLTSSAFIYQIGKDDFHTCDTPKENGEPCEECDDCKLIAQIFEELKIDSPDKAWARYFDPDNLEFQALIRRNRISEIRLLINNDCQLKCQHCFYGFDEMKGRKLLFTEYCRVLLEAINLGIKEFHFSGKEPLFNEDIFDYAKFIKEMSPESHVHVVTNGINVPKYIEQLKSFSKVYLSIDDVLGVKEYRDTTNVYDKAIRALKENNIPIQVFIDLGKHNYNKVADIINHLYDNYGVDDFYVRTLAYVGNAENLERLTLKELESVYHQIFKITSENEKINVMLNANAPFTYDILDLADDSYEVGYLFKEMANRIISTGNPNIFENFAFGLESFCHRYDWQVTLTPDGYLLGCGTEVSNPDYDQASAGNVRDCSLAELIVRGKEINILGNCSQKKEDGCLMFYNCPYKNVKSIDENVLV